MHSTPLTQPLPKGEEQNLRHALRTQQRRQLGAQFGTVAGGVVGEVERHSLAAAVGGLLTLQGGASGGSSGNANGGGVTITGGAGFGTGTQGLVNLSTSVFTSAAEQAFTASVNVTAGNVDLYSSLPVKANTNLGTVLTVPDPAQSVIGRILYISIVMIP